METPLHPTPMQRPMMKGEIYVDELNKPTFQVTKDSKSPLYVARGIVETKFDQRCMNLLPICSRTHVLLPCVVHRKLIEKFAASKRHHTAVAFVASFKHDLLFFCLSKRARRLWQRGLHESQARIR